MHRWDEHIADVVVLPDDRRADVRGRQARQPPPDPGRAARRRYRAHRRRGAAAGGILVDVKLMNRILEIDLEDRTVTGPARHQHAQAQRGAAPLRLHLSRRPGLVSMLARWRPDRDRRLVSDRRPLRPHPRPRHQHPDSACPPERLIEVGDGGGRKIRKSSTGYQLKQLFMGHQGTLGIATEATLELVTATRSRVRSVLSLSRLRDRLQEHRSARALGLGDSRRRCPVR